MVKITHLFGVILDRFEIKKKNYEETAPLNCAIWDEFSEQHYHQKARLAHFECKQGADLMHILVG